MAPFSADVKILNMPGGPNIFFVQQASVERRFVIILKNLTQGPGRSGPLT
jgi:hypothetical protein